MKERPILFSVPMLQAILEGRKTQTRRDKGIKEINANPNEWRFKYIEHAGTDSGKSEAVFEHKGGRRVTVPCPYGTAGDRLWVRENYKVVSFYEGWEEYTEAGMDFEEAHATVGYADGTTKTFSGLSFGEDGEPNEVEQAERYHKKNGFIPSIHMPRWASRIDLEIVDIRVERLQDISEDDVVDEGISIERGIIGTYLAPTGHCEEYGDLYFNGVKGDQGNTCPIDCFAELWESINGQGSWEENPWLWVVEFRRVG